MLTTSTIVINAFTYPELAPKSLGGTANDIDSFKSGIFYINIQQPGKAITNHPNQGNLDNKTFYGLIQKYGDAAKAETGTTGANGDIRAYISNNPTLVTNGTSLNSNFTQAGFISNGITDFTLSIPINGTTGTSISTINASTITNNGTGLFTYLWTISPSDAGFINTTTANPSFTPSTATTYTITAKVTDSKGVNVTKSSNITVSVPVLVSATTLPISGSVVGGDIYDTVDSTSLCFDSSNTTYWDGNCN